MRQITQRSNLKTINEIMFLFIHSYNNNSSHEFKKNHTKCLLSSLTITSNLTSHLCILPRNVPLVHLTNAIILVIFQKSVLLWFLDQFCVSRRRTGRVMSVTRRFMSSEQLQQHLNMHDDKLNLIQRFEGFLRCS